jgi:hypothetical protein
VGWVHLPQQVALSNTTKNLWILQNLVKFVISGTAVSFSRGIMILGVSFVSQRPDVDFSKKAAKLGTDIKR